MLITVSRTHDSRWRLAFHCTAGKVTDGASRKHSFEMYKYAWKMQVPSPQVRIYGFRLNNRISFLRLLKQKNSHDIEAIIRIRPVSLFINGKLTPPLPPKISSFHQWSNYVVGLGFICSQHVSLCVQQT